MHGVALLLDEQPLASGPLRHSCRAAVRDVRGGRRLLQDRMTELTAEIIWPEARNRDEPGSTGGPPCGDPWGGCSADDA